MKDGIVFDEKNLYLEVWEAGSSYDISLTTCSNSAAVLDWIAQLSHKSWMTDKMLGQLVRKFDKILDLQSNYIPKPKPKSEIEIKKLIEHTKEFTEMVAESFQERGV